MDNTKNNTVLHLMLTAALVCLGTVGCSDAPLDDTELDTMGGPSGDNSSGGGDNTPGGGDGTPGGGDGMPGGGDGTPGGGDGTPGGGDGMPGGGDGMPGGGDGMPGGGDGTPGGGDDMNHTSGCELSGVAAVKIVADVSWPASLAMEAGNGQVEIWFKAEISDDGQQITAAGQVCEVSVPDFHTNALAGNDTHGTVIPSEGWAGAPPTSLVIEMSSREPGSALQVNATPMFLGTDMNDPFGPWPETHSSLSPIDHDNDGHPGITAYAAMGAGYANPRIAVFDPNLRANRIFLGLRNIIGLDGMLTTCNDAEGSATLSINQRSFGCLTPDNRPCDSGQTDLLDSNIPQFQVTDANFQLKRLPNGGDCSAIIASIP
jgi:hypothetical protein